jgi:hypothetical protein
MNPPTITTAQRNVLYDDILVRITAIGDVLTVIERGEFDKAQKLADEFADYLRLLADDLGWGKLPEANIELKSPSEVLRRSMERLRRIAEIEDKEESEERAEVQAREARNVLMRETCDQLLAELPPQR